MSDTMTEGVIAQWLMKVGDQVSSGDILAEVETETLRKLDTRVPPYFKGSADHYPIYFVTNASMRGFDLGCEDSKLEIYRVIFSAFDCMRHKT